MELSKFCPRCGRETDRLYGDKQKLCADCYPEKNDLLEIPEVVEIEVCSVCGRMKQRTDWLEKYTIEEQLGEKFAEFSDPDVDMELQYWEDDEGTKVRVHASKDDIQDHYDTRVKFDQQQCPSCSRFEGGFYKVKIQLRGEQDLKPVSNQIIDMAAELTNENRKDFLSNIEKTDHGYNIYLSTEAMAKKILDMLRSRYGPEIKRSYELIGEQDGQEVYRNVISVRFNN